jgi:fumarate hydratase class II
MHRIYRDSLGEVKVPRDAYFGPETQRALQNFQISELRFPRVFIESLALIKLAAAKANMSLGLLEKRIGSAIVKAAEEVLEGKFEGEFPLDVFQTGSGTSTNMNVNEVIASRAAEILGGERGDRSLVHPNDHVNLGQSTNDVFPTAIHIAAVEETDRKLLPSLRLLSSALREKAAEFSDVVKAGRTHMQDAVPITLGQEFSGYAAMVENGVDRVEKAVQGLLELPIGGTAVGTGLNTDPRFAELVVKEINSLTGRRYRLSRNSFEALQGRDACVEFSGALKTVAVSLMKIANDLRIMSSGPYTGLAEIELPALQPGSSIMPGKVNPVIPEAVRMVAAQVIGNDLVITLAGQGGELELNVMMPIIAYNLLQSISIEANAAKALGEKCVAGVKADRDRCLRYAEGSAALVTAISPIVGYDLAAKLARKALAEGRSIREILIEEKILSREELDKVLDLRRMAAGGRAG